MAEANDPWDIKTDDSRAADTSILYVIFCEDKNSEPEYFKSFETDNLKINAIPNQRKGKLNLNATIKKCVDDGLIEFDDTGYRVKPGIAVNIWCVYDRDVENTDFTRVSPDTNLEWSLAIQTAHRAGLKVAWSNDAFELWVLLHFQDIGAMAPIHRDDIYLELTEVFKKLKTSPALIAFTSDLRFNYAGAFKRKSPFIEFVLPELKSRIDEAIQRAELLANSYDKARPYHERNPCTIVFELVKDLLRDSGN